jgi:SET domain-containing protein
MKGKSAEQLYRVGRSRTGLGLFAKTVIEKGTFIVEYTGHRISNAEANQRWRARYLFEVNSRWTIDGSPRWNDARYVNHSCRPNAESVVSRGRIRIKAVRRIKVDEEITFNYGKSYFDLFIKPHGCRCASCSPL